jgi:hypothetical protein
MEHEATLHADPRTGAGDGPTPTDDRCRLCGGRGARDRPARLGRYARTCEDCEARRGSHLQPAGAAR